VARARWLEATESLTIFLITGRWFLRSFACKECAVFFTCGNPSGEAWPASADSGFGHKSLCDIYLRPNVIPLTLSSGFGAASASSQTTKRPQLN